MTGTIVYYASSSTILEVDRSASRKKRQLITFKYHPPGTGIDFENPLHFILQLCYIVLPNCLVKPIIVTICTFVSKLISDATLPIF